MSDLPPSDPNHPLSQEARGKTWAYSIAGLVAIASSAIVQSTIGTNLSWWVYPLVGGTAGVVSTIVADQMVARSGFTDHPHAIGFRAGLVEGLAVTSMLAATGALGGYVPLIYSDLTGPSL